MGLIAPSLVPPKARKTCSSAQFIRFCLLRLGDVKGMSKKGFRFAYIRTGRMDGHPTGDTIDFSLAPPLLVSCIRLIS